MAKLTTLFVNDIVGKFFVPDYQRGYRWTEKEVVRLLNDVYDLKGIGGQASRNYCLQPIVVRNLNGNDIVTVDDAGNASISKPKIEKGYDFEVIDGQQRLTTLFLIYNYMFQKIGEAFGDLKFSLEYQTRPNSAKFLLNIDKNSKTENIDYYFLSNAYEAIKNWFNSTKDPFNAMTAIKTLFADNVKIIWYEVDNSEDGAALFTRLNIGKISLTNSELVKAMFLSKNNPNINIKKQNEIALQWDNLERELHNESLWGFLTNNAPEDYQTHIDLILDLIADKKETERDEYFTFFYFDKLRQTQDLTEIWEQKIRQTFLLLKNWHEYLDFYHKIGYLIASGYKSLNEIYKESKNKTTSGFSARLDALIKESIKPDGGKSYSDWTYSEDSEKIRRLLFLFNVESSRKNATGTAAHWFSFSKFKHCKDKETSWSLEHIHAVKSDIRYNQKFWRSWLELHKEFLENQTDKNSALIEQIEKLLKLKDFSRERFERVQEEVLKIFPTDKNIEAHIDSIANLALIQCSENSALGNSTFDVKRNKIIEMDLHAEFIPLCTIRVFLKYYTKSQQNQINCWSLQDMQAYIAAINEVLKNYLSEPVEL